MKVLVIEDNNIKYGLIVEFLQKASREIEISRAASYQSGVERLVQERFDLSILDMTLPVSDLDVNPIGIDFLTFGGQLILRECARRKIRTKFIVVSQYSTFVRGDEEVSFERMREEILAAYSQMILGCIKLDRASEDWKKEINESLSNEGLNS